MKNLKVLFTVLCMLCTSMVWAEPGSIVFDFEDDGAHRSEGTNSYVSNEYSENGVTISCQYFDCVTTTKISGSWLATGRIAKNTTNVPTLTIGPISITGKTVTGISYSQQGATAIKQQLEHSTDGTNWTTDLSNQSTTSTTSAISKTGLSISGSNLYIRISGSVSSSTSSNRDMLVDDITISYESGSAKTSLYLLHKILVLFHISLFQRSYRGFCLFFVTTAQANDRWRLSVPCSHQAHLRLIKSLGPHQAALLLHQS